MVITGRNTTKEALLSDFSVSVVFLQNNLTISADPKIVEIISLCKKRKIPIKTETSQLLKKILKTNDHQGVGALVNFGIKNLSSKNISEIINLSKSYFYISESTFDQNIGSIIRTCEIAGLGGVIIPKKTEINSTIAKISAGAIFHIPIFSCQIFEAIKLFKNEGYKIAGIERNGTIYYHQNLDGRFLFIIGGEDKSLTDGIRSRCDTILEIPQKGKINSLNMSVASSIIIFEHIKQINNSTKNV